MYVAWSMCPRSPLPSCPPERAALSSHLTAQILLARQSVVTMPREQSPCQTPEFPANTCTDKTRSSKGARARNADLREVVPSLDTGTTLAARTVTVMHPPAPFSRPLGPCSRSARRRSPCATSRSTPAAASHPVTTSARELEVCTCASRSRL